MSRRTAGASLSRMIRIAVLYNHPAVRTGVDALLRAQPGLAPVGTAADPRELWPLLHRARPGVVLLDHQPGSGDRLLLCLRIKARLLHPRVVICATDAGTDLIVPATLAGVDAIVDKAADLRELLHAIRAVGAGERVLPLITPRLQSEAAARLEPIDRAIFAMRLAGTTASDIAATVGLSRRELGGRVAAIFATLATGRGARDDAHAAPAMRATGEGTR